MKTLPFVLLGLAALSLAGCNGTTVFAAGSAAGIWYTKDKDKPPADTQDQIAEHESWCYETMGYPECYTKPQMVEPDRLINVDPANHYPLTPNAYWDAAYSAR